jgi:hypothetical protein
VFSSGRNVGFMEAMLKLQVVQFMKKCGLHGSNAQATGCSVHKEMWASWK